MKIKFSIYTILFVVVLLSILFSCTKVAVKVVPTVINTTVTNLIAISETSGGELTNISNQMVISLLFDPFFCAQEDSEEDLQEFTIQAGIEPEYHNQSVLITDYFHVALCKRKRIYFIGGVG